MKMSNSTLQFGTFLSDEYDKLRQLVFDLDLGLWNNFQQLLRKRPDKISARFNLTEPVVNELVSYHVDLKKLASGVFISFRLLNKDFLDVNKFLMIDKKNFLFKKISYLDISFWYILKRLALVDISVSMLCFSVPQSVAKWATTASDDELYLAAIGTVDNLVLRYPVDFIQNILIGENKNNSVFQRMIYPTSNYLIRSH